MRAALSVITPQPLMERKIHVQRDSVYGSMTRLQAKTKSLAVTGEPSDHFAPARSLKVQVLPSALDDQLSAAAGIALPR